jgi:hypothetical protein
VRERWLVVTYALYDRQLALVVQLLHAAHRLVPAEVRVDLEQIVFFDANRRAMLVIHRIAVRHDGVQPVVTAKPFEDNEDPARIERCRLEARLAEDARYRTESAEQTKPQSTGADPNHVATRDA